MTILSEDTMTMLKEIGSKIEFDCDKEDRNYSAFSNFDCNGTCMGICSDSCEFSCEDNCSGSCDLTE